MQLVAVLRKLKIYFYDSGFIKAGEGIRLENTCALCLLKHVQYLQQDVVSVRVAGKWLAELSA